MDSILDTVKSALGIEIDEISFDNEIITHINSVFMTLTQLGIGSDDNFKITNEIDTWSDFLGATTKNFEGIKSYVYLKVRLMFDPPSSSFVLDAMNRQAQELEWRLYAQAEPPYVPDVPEEV